MNMIKLQKTLKKNSKINHNLFVTEGNILMSRTFRKKNFWFNHPYRYPHTYSEIKQLDAILHEKDLIEYPISKINRIRSREHSLPTVYDDIVISAYYEMDYK